MTTVLLVDDEKEFVDTLAERISLRMMNPHVAYTGPQALEILRTAMPDVVVLDLRMPGMDGAEVLVAIRRQYPSLSVIILTGHGDDADQVRLTELGAAAYLQKPVDIDILLGTIQKVTQAA